jgi:NADH dehydrogenase [ubiquinone] 1 alpha subcomplex assembly factor 7
MTPLAAEIRRMIADEGPLPVARYMALCLTHPRHGYYVTHDPLGERGDFVTAPEVSQMFGELIGLWAATVWRMMGAPRTVNLIELGPGRGTLMADALRAARLVPAFRAAIRVHLVETSPVLKQRQRETLSWLAEPPTWHGDIAHVPSGPSIVIANEFFDALPVHQAVKASDGWHERVVGRGGDDETLVFGLSPEPLRGLDAAWPANVRGAAEGALFEWRSDAVVREVARRLVRDNGAALVIDYGHGESAPGETLQAVAGHGFADPLASPGEMDLTAHVDFAALGRAARQEGAGVNGPVTQGDFLRRLGIAERAQRLAANATAKQASAVEAALTRLTDDRPTGMGTLFKAMAIAHPGLATLPGFEVATMPAECEPR